MKTLMSISMLLLLNLPVMAQFQGQRVKISDSEPFKITSKVIVVSGNRDEKFGGYFIDVNATIQKNRKLTIYNVLELQYKLRNCLEEKSGSFFRIKQQVFLSGCLEKTALFSITTAGINVNSQDKGLTVVFDMDETLLNQWHKLSLTNPERTTLIVKNRDHVLEESKGKIQLSPLGVTIRPGANELLTKLSLHPRIKNIIFFTARDRKSAEELKDYFLNNNKNFAKKFAGLYSRNHLRFDGKIPTPSKDLRIFDPTLRNVILVDDNISRVMQKELCFNIPKFNADLFLTSKVSRNSDVLEANNVILPYVYRLLDQVAKAPDRVKYFYPHSAKSTEAQKIDVGALILNQSGIDMNTAEHLITNKVFEQEFSVYTAK